MDTKGTVYWITGLSGAGKTTIGKLLFADMRKKKSNVILLDGDVLRDIYRESAYGVEDRKRLAFQHARLCKMLADQGIDVIICVIAMFDECRKWNKANIDNYKEIYLYVEMEELIRRDQKQLYSRALKKEISNVMGIDITFEEPKRPDIVVDNSGKYTPGEVLLEIKRHLEGNDMENISDYRNYWNHFYKGGVLLANLHLSQKMH